MDPFAGYRESRNVLFDSMDKKMERDRQAPLDEARLRQAQLQYDLTNREIADNDAAREFGAGLVGKSPLEVQQGGTDFALKMGNIPGAVDLTERMTKGQLEIANTVAQEIRRNGPEAGVAIGEMLGWDKAKMGHILKTVKKGEDLYTPDGQGGQIINIYDPISDKYHPVHVPAPRPVGGAGGGSWSKPYTTNIGGKEVLLQENLGTGQIRQVSTGSIMQDQIDNLEDDTVERMAALKLLGRKGGDLPRNKLNTAAQQEIENAVTKAQKALGWDAGDVVQKPAEFEGMARNLMSLQKREGMAKVFVRNMDYQMDQFKELVERIRYDNPAILNAPWQKFQTYVEGNGDLAAYVALVTDLSNEAAKLSSGAEASVAALTEGQAEHWQSIHYPSMPTNEMFKLLNETVKIAHGRTNSYKDEIQEVVGKMRDIPTVPKGTEPEPKKPGSLEVGDIEDGYRYKGGDKADPNSWEKVN